jgi:hypothetical protein
MAAIGFEVYTDHAGSLVFSLDQIRPVVLSTNKLVRPFSFDGIFGMK